MLVYNIRFGRTRNLLFKRLIIVMLTYLVVLYATSKLIASLNLYDEANFNVSKSVMLSQENVSSVIRWADKKLKFILLWNAPHQTET